MRTYRGRYPYQNSSNKKGTYRNKPNNIMLINCINKNTKPYWK